MQKCKLYLKPKPKRKGVREGGKLKVDIEIIRGGNGEQYRKHDMFWVKNKKARKKMDFAKLVFMT